MQATFCGSRRFQGSSGSLPPIPCSKSSTGAPSNTEPSLSAGWFQRYHAKVIIASCRSIDDHTTRSRRIHTSGATLSPPICRARGEYTHCSLVVFVAPSNPARCLSKTRQQVYSTGGRRAFKARAQRGGSLCAQRHRLSPALWRKWPPGSLSPAAKCKQTGARPLPDRNQPRAPRFLRRFA